MTSECGTCRYIKGTHWAYCPERKAPTDAELLEAYDRRQAEQAAALLERVRRTR